MQHALGCRKTAFRRRRPARTHVHPSTPTRQDRFTDESEEGITKTSDACGRRRRRPNRSRAENRTGGGHAGDTPSPPVFFCLTPRPAAGPRCISYKTLPSPPHGHDVVVATSTITTNHPHCNRHTTLLQSPPLRTLPPRDRTTCTAAETCLPALSLHRLTSVCVRELFFLPLKRKNRDRPETRNKRK